MKQKLGLTLENNVNLKVLIKFNFSFYDIIFFNFKFLNKNKYCIYYSNFF